jgi:hypothetical protein
VVEPWLKFYDEGVPATIDYPGIPVDQLLSKAASKHPDHPAIIFGARVGSRLMDAKFTYRQVDDAPNCRIQERSTQVPYRESLEKGAERGRDQERRVTL